MKIVIHGVHRSGTSLTASLLDRAGFWYAEDEFQMPAQVDNPKGFWERLDVVDLNDRMLASQNMNWFTLAPKIADSTYQSLSATFANDIQQILTRLDSHGDWFLKDPRLSVTWPVWKSFVQATDHLIVNRHPVAVAQSLQRRNGIAIKHGLIFWYHQTRMLVRSLQDEKNVSNLVFGPHQENQTHLLEVINSICSAGKHPELQMEDFASMFDANLINYKEHDDRLAAEHPTILTAWEHARRGEFKQLLALPEVRLADLEWGDLDSNYALANIQQKADRDLQYIQLENARVHEESKKLHNENRALHKEKDSLQIENEKLHKIQQTLNEQLAELKLGTLKIAREVNIFMSSGQYLGSAVLAKILSKLRIARYRSLHLALDIAKHGHSAAELERVLPKPSNRRLLVKSIVRQPFSFVRRLTFKRVLKGLKTLLGKGEDDAGIQQALFRYKETGESFSAGLTIFDPDNPIDWMHDKIEFQETEKPDVSIVIPVYNNYLTTLACLRSIAEFTDFDEISYQVVIADDCSSDETQELSSRVPGLKIVRCDANLGFLNNCNHALSKVKSPYVVLLNNDTNVQENWLQELLQPLQADSGIGVTGPVFLYPDGRLQEAGGIIFSDASGWNYGRNDQPAKPQYSFARDVDYVSGACLVFRKSLWDQIEGFDQQFAPAYYEDTDFCFETRKRGQRVRYVPTSKVVHFEGVSHGNSEESGIKKYQAINREKFATKWNAILEQEHFDGPDDLFVARIHGRNRKTLLFIDHHVPFYDKDAGSKVALRYLELMIEEGIHVIFMGENFYPHQPYTEQLKALGVEVLYGEHYKKNWFAWLQENAKYLDAIYLNRPHVSEKYIDKIRSLENIPYLAYHGADLHYVRVAREEALGIKNTGDRTSVEWKEVELDIMRKCDVSLWLSENEVKTIKAEDASINAAYMPMYWFDESDFKRDRSVLPDRNILFVGGFGHPPNRDGLEWFLKEIFPAVVARFVDVKLTVIGSNCPDEIRQLEGKNLEILGFVSEAELVGAYENTRVSIVPLRYGAGVKGKIIESMQYGVTVLTTSVGAEGLHGNPQDYLNIGDDSIVLAEQLIRLLEDDNLCMEKVATADQSLKQHLSRDQAIKALGLIIGSSA